MDLKTALTLLSIALTIYGLITHPRHNKCHSREHTNHKDTTMAFGIDDAAGMAFGGILGLINSQYNDDRQLRQQQELMNMQIAGQKEMGRFNQDLALQMWDKTNYAAQRNQMEKAGLNVGLMYKGAGQGGTTATPTGTVAGAHAPAGGGEVMQGLGMALQYQMQQAQIEAIKAQTENTKADTGLKGAQTGVTAITMQKLIAETTNEQLKAPILKLDASIKQIAANVADKTQGSAITQITADAENAVQQVRNTKNTADITDATKATTIQKMNLAAVTEMLHIEATRAGIVNTQADTAKTRQATEEIAAQTLKIANDALLSWENLTLDKRKTLVSEVLANVQSKQMEFNTSTPKEVEQWLNLLTNTAGAAAKLVVAGKVN